MKLLPLLILLTSCATYSPLTYKRVITYKQIGVKCEQNYFFHIESGKCVYLPTLAKAQAERAPQAAQTQAKLTRKLPKSAKSASGPSKIDCRRLFTQINKCSI